MNRVKSFCFTEKRYPEVVRILNDIAELEQRFSHDSAKRLIIEAGEKRIEELKNAEKEPKNDN